MATNRRLLNAGKGPLRDLDAERKKANELEAAALTNTLLYGNAYKPLQPKSILKKDFVTGDVRVQTPKETKETDTALQKIGNEQKQREEAKNSGANVSKIKWKQSVVDHSTNNDTSAFTDFTDSVIKNTSESRKTEYDHNKKLENARNDRENYVKAGASGRNPSSSVYTKYDGTKPVSKDDVIVAGNVLAEKVRNGTATDDDYRKYVNTEALYGEGMYNAFNDRITVTGRSYGVVSDDDIWKSQNDYEAEATALYGDINALFEKYARGEATDAELNAMAIRKKKFDEREKVYLSAEWSRRGTIESVETLKRRRDEAKKAYDKTYVFESDGPIAQSKGYYPAGTVEEKTYNEAEEKYKRAFAADSYKKIEDTYDEYKKEMTASGYKFNGVMENGGQVSYGNTYSDFVSKMYNQNASEGEDYHVDELRDYGTEEQKAVFTYLYQTKGREAALKYSLEINPIIAEQSHKANKKKYEDSGFWGRLGMGISDSFMGGLAGDFVYNMEGVGRLLTGDTSYHFQNVAQQKANAVSEAEENPVAKFGMAALRTTGAQTPMIITSMATGGASGILGNTSSVLFFASAAGSSYSESINKGNGWFESVGYSTTVAAFELLTEKIFDVPGIYGGSKVDDAVKGALSKGIGRLSASGKTKSALTFAGYLGVNALGEGFEEGVAELFSPVWSNLWLGEQNEMFTEEHWKEIGYASLLGMASSFLMAGPSMPYLYSEAKGDTAVWSILNGKGKSIYEVDAVLNNESSKKLFEKVIGIELSDNTDVARMQVAAVSSAVSAWYAKNSGKKVSDLMKTLTVSDAGSVAEFVEKAAEVIPEPDAEYVANETAAVAEMTEIANKELKKTTVDEKAVPETAAGGIKIDKDGSIVLPTAAEEWDASNIKKNETEKQKRKTVKDELTEAAPELQRMESVSNINFPATKLVDGQQKTVILDAYSRVLASKGIGDKVYRNDIGEIDIGTKRIKKGLKYLSDDSEYLAVLAIPDVLEKGIHISTDTDHDNRGYPTFTFAAPVNINGKSGYMAVVVKQTGTNKYKMHRVLSPDGSILDFSDSESLENERSTGYNDKMTVETDGESLSITNASDSIISQDTLGVKFENDGSIMLPTAEGEINAAAANKKDILPGFSDVTTETTEMTGRACGVSEENIGIAVRLSHALGVKVAFYEDLTSDERGQYLPKTGVIWVNSKYQDVFSNVFGHELTHRIESSKFYKALDRFVAGKLKAEGKSMDELIRRKKESYGRRGASLSDEAARREVVAKYVGEVLLNNEAVIADIARTDSGLGGFLLSKIDSLVAKITGKNKEAVYIRRVQQMFRKALEDVSRNEGAKVSDGSEQQRGSVYEDAGLNELAERYRRGDLSQADYLEAYNEYLEQNPGLEDEDFFEGRQFDLDEANDVNKPHIADYNNYTDEEYNAFGWVRQNGVLNEAQYFDFTSKFAGAVKRKIKFNKTKNGEFIIPVSDISNSDIEGVNRFLVFAKGKIDKPVISSIIEIYSYNETELTKIRSGIYGLERKGIRKQAGELFTRYNAFDFRNNGQKGNILSGSGHNNGNRQRGGSGSQTSGTSEKTSGKVSFAKVSQKSDRYKYDFDDANDFADDEMLYDSSFAAKYDPNNSERSKAIRKEREKRKAERKADEFSSRGLEGKDWWSKNRNKADRMFNKRELERLAKIKSELEDADELTVEQVTALWGEMRKLQRNVTAMSMAHQITNEELTQVTDLLRGDRTIEDIEKLPADRYNIDGIIAVAKAKLEYENVASQIREYRARHKARLYEVADGYVAGNVIEDKKGPAAGLRYRRETMERNVRDVVKDKGKAEGIIDEYFKPVHKNEADRTRFKEKLRDRIRKLGISTKVEKGNQVSEAYAVQFYGEVADNIAYLEQNQNRVKHREGKDLEEWRALEKALWEDNPNLDKGKIERAVEEFRKIYDELYQSMNEVRVRNGYEPVKYRRGYFPHFAPGTSDGVLAKIAKGLGINSEVTDLPTTINGLTHTFKPGIKWMGNILERTGFATEYDALTGFDRYLEAASDVIYHTDDIQKLRALSSRIRYNASDDGIKKRADAISKNEELREEEKQAALDGLYKEGKFTGSGFTVVLDDYTNILAGKKSISDRNAEYNLGRKMYNVVKGLESRIAANMIAGNLASALTNFIPITQAASVIRLDHVLHGAFNTVLGKDGMQDMSDFLVNRRGSDLLALKTSEKISKALSKPMEFIDSFASGTIVRARFYDNLQRGMSEDAALEEADSFAASVMADRSKGSMPVLFEQKNPLMKLFTQFQLEVNNQLSFATKDLWRYESAKAETGKNRLTNKTFLRYVWGLFWFALMAFLFDELYEWLIGRRPALDPIGMILDYADDAQEDGWFEALGGLGEDVAENMPFVGGLMGGGRIPISSALPDINKIYNSLSGDANWKKKAVTVGKEISKPFIYLVPPFGGGLGKKAIEGVSGMVQGGSYTADSDGNAELQYPIYNDSVGETILNGAKSVLFGRTSTAGGKKWIKDGFKNFTADYTDAYKGMIELDGVSQKEAYEFLDGLRNVKDPKKGDDVSVNDLKRQYIEESGIDDAAKGIAFYYSLANDKEKEFLYTYRDSEDFGAISGVLMGMKEHGNSVQPKRELLLESELETDVKRDIYESIIVSSDDKEKESAKIDAFEDAGMTVDDYLSCINKKYELDNDDGLNASGRATEFARWVDNNFKPKQADIIKENVKFSSGFSVSADNYEKYREAGLSPDEAYNLINGFGELEPEDGKEQVSDWQKARVIVDGDLSDEDKLTSLGVVLSSGTYERVSTAYDKGISFERYFDVKDEYDSRKANYTADEKDSYVDRWNSSHGRTSGKTKLTFNQIMMYEAIEGIGGDLTLSAGGITTAPKYYFTKHDKAVLWQILDGAWSHENNPFDTSVGLDVRKSMGWVD